MAAVTEVYSADWVLPVDSEPIRDGAVAVRDSRIVEVGPAADVSGDARHHFEECAIVPGFVNAHTHLEYTTYAGFGDGVADFAEWLAIHVSRKRRVGWEEHLAIARLGAAECLASGVTTVGDCSFSGAAAVAVAELGLRAIVYLEVFGSDPDDVLRQFEELHAAAAPSQSDRVRLGVSPHAPYSVSRDAYRACARLGLPLATHLSESASELRYLLDGGGPWQGLDFLVDPPGATGPRLLAGEGLLQPGVVAVHCVTVEPDEIDLLARSGAGVVHCPRSNALLGCGIAPVAAIRAAGGRVGLGTDSPASAPSFDMLDEMRAALLLARAGSADAAALTATDCLSLATLGSAQALGLEDEIGSLTPGKRADLAVVSLSGSPFLPWEDPAVAVVLGGTPERVCRTIVDGSTRYVRGGFEWHELRQNAAAARGRMLASGLSASSR
jgi:5-methylthioadenosine/S-adenosylhomocysteine deaminase